MQSMYSAKELQFNIEGLLPPKMCPKDHAQAKGKQWSLKPTITQVLKLFGRLRTEVSAVWGRKRQQCNCEDWTVAGMKDLFLTYPTQHWPPGWSREFADSSAGLPMD